jgi:small subunit ribosomal protein S5
MTENTNNQNPKEASKVVSTVSAQHNRPGDRMGRHDNKFGRRGPKHEKGGRDQKQQYDKRIISIRRVARVYKGGKRMRLSVVLVVGDKKGKLGMALGKGPDVKSAEDKAYSRAIKNMQFVQLKGKTIPHEVEAKFKAAKVLIKPAAPGTGIIAGSSVRSVLEIVGVKDILTKQLGGSNSITNAYATIKALKMLRSSRL